MTTWSDFFCGAGGSSSGLVSLQDVHVRIAANHWKTAIEIHNANHQNTDHSSVDLHEEKASYFPRTDCAWFSPECTKWSQASGAGGPAIEEGLFEDPLSDDVKQRSRLLMFDVLKFIEYHRYRMVIVENVVDIATQSKYQTAWTVWRQELRALGYNFRVVSLNSMHAQLMGAPAPQSRDRIYIVAWPDGERAPDLDRVVSPEAYCGRCGVVRNAVQSFKNGRTVGRYRQAYVYCCPGCGQVVEPGWLPAAAAIDWSIRGERIGDRAKPLKPKTLDRIAAGIARYWGPLAIEAAGNTYDAADPKHRNYGKPDGYYRSWPIDEPLKTLHTVSSKALAAPVEGRDGKEAVSLDAPMRTQTTRAETALANLPFIAEMYGTSTARPVTEPAGTFTAGGNHHALVMSYYSRDDAMKPTSDPVATITTEPRHALITRHNKGGAEMTTPASEYMRTLTTTAQQSIMRRPGDVTAADLKAARDMIHDVEFRMFQHHEVAAGMAFPGDYNWQPPNRMRPVSNRDLVKAAGNAVTPPAARDLGAVCMESLGQEAVMV
ncbi:DNA cytosine methyltransferase [Paramicrobacterium chengjingii]|uniref:DNA (cytosine-5-)-methyltransferase n=1 Tax=Paramicrobacterium chengjingii TaxID=2769067 RepID=A0ABX6YLZ9_9MICO|nr:DNA cytosine methyltransferase [Microbacterium chengjingii]QPZ39725.1 DNA cytosine methyltransferase [Microbacterium chengjingii]